MLSQPWWLDQGKREGEVVWRRRWTKNQLHPVDGKEICCCCNGVCICIVVVQRVPSRTSLLAVLAGKGLTSRLFGLRVELICVYSWKSFLTSSNVPSKCNLDCPPLNFCNLNWLHCALSHGLFICQSVYMGSIYCISYANTRVFYVGSNHLRPIQWRGHSASAPQWFVPLLWTAFIQLVYFLWLQHWQDGQVRSHLQGFVSSS